MNLRDWRKENGLSVEEVARRLGIDRTPRTLLRIEAGEVKVDADLAAMIVELTGDLVTLQDLHETRLSWLQSRATAAAATAAEAGEAGR